MYHVTELEKRGKICYACYNLIFNFLILIIIIILFTENDKNKWWKNNDKKQVKIK